MEYPTKRFCRNVDNNKLFSTLLCGFVYDVFQSIAWSRKLATEPFFAPHAGSISKALRHDRFHSAVTGARKATDRALAEFAQERRQPFGMPCIMPRTLGPLFFDPLVHPTSPRVYHRDGIRSPR